MPETFAIAIARVSNLFPNVACLGEIFRPPIKNILAHLGRILVAYFWTVVVKQSSILQLSHFFYPNDPLACGRLSSLPTRPVPARPLPPAPQAHRAPVPDTAAQRSHEPVGAEPKAGEPHIRAFIAHRNLLTW